MSESAAPRQHPLAAALRTSFERHRDAVLQAPTGAGKSTIVPLALLQEPFVAGDKILMLEPRRLAARAVAARMAALLGERVGATVGYRMRLDTRVSAATRIEVITEGVLTRMLQDDPTLEGVACLIFDEYHERSLQADLGLALALDARRQLGAAFRVLIMSATLEPERVVDLLEDAAVVDVPGRAFAVQIHYTGRGLPLLPARHASGPDAQSPERAMVRAIERALAESPGDVLAFLPGVGEIRRVQAQLEQTALPPWLRVMPLYGQMSAEAQDAVLSPTAAPLRKLVLATNIAETSLTIPGVTAVVDSGLVRRARFDTASGMSRLELTRISRAASEQRAGRAGRVAPGVCYRLWSEGGHAGLAAATPPEILEADLAPLMLELAGWGVSDASQLRWLDPPPVAAQARARELLVRLGAVAAHGRLSVRGRQMLRLPVHPRLAHMLVAARELGCVALAARLAALLTERELLRAGSGERDPDIRSRLQLSRHAAPGAVEQVQLTARALEAAVLGLPTATAPPQATQRSSALLSTVPEGYLPGALLALAFPDRVGLRREGPDGRYLLANGHGAAFPARVSLAREPLIVAVELDDREREARIDVAAPLSVDALEQLFGAQIVNEERFGWDVSAEAVLARRVRRFGALVLEDRLLSVADDARATPALLEALQRLGIEALPWDAESRSLQARMQFVGSLARGELTDWPASDDATLLVSLPQWLAPYLGGITRRAALARVPLREALQARLSGAQRRALEALAPRELVVPSGSHIAIDYLDANAPCLSVRLQEVFGLAEAPRIGGGVVAVTLKLLSPAQRPVQITRDLAGFWRSSYAAVRKDLRGRYPKHHWPDDPLEALPTRGAKRVVRRP